MANSQNLKPPFSPTEARENQRKSQEARKRNREMNKTFSESVKIMLKEEVKDPKQLQIIKKSGMPMSGKPTYMDFLVASTLMKSIKKGSVDDILKYMQITGEKPNVENSPSLDKLDEMLRELKNNAETESETK